MSDVGTTMNVRISYSEKSLLVDAAARRGVSLSEFVRRAVLLDAAVLDFVHSGEIRPPVVECGEASTAGGSRRVRNSRLKGGMTQ